ncbi:Modification methylase MjaII [Desulfamplus magnetovallimortis]|uniref:Modification methylase MjaII n=1 Tax=Desulfamplus magnetovallimortis TaxID=1246637 RepID=A0A1W1HL66_9BACT|nr:DNA methyltransferase [Desulfamplus magnetovallimortis]SLM33231.1 Modification methylase MjaII [Desulfamplus magnetovallimortis]
MRKSEMQNFMTIQEASVWASKYIGKNVTPSNISYLLQYGRIPKNGNNGNAIINKQDLEEYYNAHYETKEYRWKKQLGDDLNWKLSFSEYKESETTKHVHRLHSYKGKFIPQLVEYFLDQHTDKFKKEVFFNEGDIILDPFCGSGTTLVQANELNLHSIGIDVSAFNAFMSNIKIGKYDVKEIKKSADLITKKLNEFQKEKNNVLFEQELLGELKIFNDQYFPSPQFKYDVRQKKINDKLYGQQHSDYFLNIYETLISKYKIELKQEKDSSFLDKWFLKVVRQEIDFVFEQIKSISNIETKKILALVLSRTIRSCRATTHADLATLKEPVITTYYCKKHGKICKPLFSISSWWQRYIKDTIKRIIQFDKLRSNTYQKCLIGDSRTINIVQEIGKKHHELSKLLENKKIDGIFSSPPYVGLINYHEQHAYAYDLFGFKRADDFEIGPLFKGQGVEARKSYVKGISDVLNNCKQYLKKDYDIFLVANDKYRLYPQIADLSGMKIVNEYKRPVLNRVEKDRSAYSEIIFHLKEQ